MQSMFAKIVSRLNELSNHPDIINDEVFPQGFLSFNYITNGSYNAILFNNEILLWDDEELPELVNDEDELYEHCYTVFKHFAEIVYKMMNNKSSQQLN